jgi:16S rRNA (guanine1516-N2)-methyltransferase
MTLYYIVPENQGLFTAAERIAHLTGGVLAQEIIPECWNLFVGQSGFLLYAPDASLKPITIDFSSAEHSYRRKRGGGKKQAIAKAVGVTSKHTPTVLDATAGLGGDAFVLASLGCEVLLYERHPILFAMLESAISQARHLEEGELREIAHRMHCMHGSILDKDIAPERMPDVVYLDPMFPERTKSALVKKEMRILKALVGDDPDADALLSAARCLAQKRIVVKRPKQAPFLAGETPAHQLVGKANRFDVYQILEVGDL